MVVLICCSMSIRAEVLTGSCGANGKNLTWTLDTQTGFLKIEGTGKMKDQFSLWKMYRGFIKTVEIAEGVTSIGKNVLAYCSYISSITLPESLESIGDEAFRSCTAISTITIPRRVTTIGNNAFLGCYFVPENFINRSSCRSANYWGAELCEKETPEGVILNGSEVIRCRNHATTAIIPEGTTSILASAFNGCKSLASIVVPESVTSIGSSAFSGCTSLRSITIPGALTKIEDGTFSSCYGLTSVDLPETLTEICHTAFANCAMLLNVDIPCQTKIIGSSAFSGCSALATVTLPDELQQMGDFAFEKCEALTSITLPAQLASIGDMAFSECSSLATIQCLAPTPPHITSTTFSGYGKLFVDQRYIEAYQASPLWSAFEIVGKSSFLEVSLMDGESYALTEDMEVSKITFTRDIKAGSVNTWQSLFLPFSIDIEAHADDFEVAQIFTISPVRDTNGDGFVDSHDELCLIVSPLTTGKTEPNVPYVYRPKHEGQLTITEENTILYSAQDGTIDFSTPTHLYSIRGIYEPLVLSQDGSDRYISTANGNIVKANTTRPLPSFKWYMHVESIE